MKEKEEKRILRCSEFFEPHNTKKNHEIKLSEIKNVILQATPFIKDVYAAHNPKTRT